MKISKRILLIGSLGLIVALLAVVAGQWAKSNVHALETQQASKLSPIIMIPGSNAGQNRFNQLVAELNQTSQEQHSLLRVLVHKDNSLSYTGTIRANDDEPIIVIGFQDNQDGFNNIKDQAGWFNHAMQILMARYRFKNVKIVGHSNGGLILTYALEHTALSRNLRIKKIMTIAAPYNLNDANSHGETTMLRSLVTYRTKIPRNLVVYSVAGSQSFNTDGLVPLYSVLAGRYVYQGQVRHFTELTVTGSQSEHSKLPQNSQIIQLIKNFIVDED